MTDIKSKQSDLPAPKKKPAAAGKKTATSNDDDKEPAKRVKRQGSQNASPVTPRRGSTGTREGAKPKSSTLQSPKEKPKQSKEHGPRRKDMKAFVIPRKAKEKELLEEVSLDSNSFQKYLLPAIVQQYRDPASRASFDYEKAFLVHNEKLEKEFQERRKELKEEGRTDKELAEQYAFLMVENMDIAKLICGDGLHKRWTGESKERQLGHGDMGVYLNRYSDILSPNPLDQTKEHILLVLKVLKGKVKAVPLTPHRQSIEPTPKFDCHVAKNIVLDLATSGNRIMTFVSNQIYCYQFGDVDMVPRPQQVCPFAVVHFTYKERQKETPATTGITYSELAAKKDGDKEDGTKGTKRTPLLSLAYTTPITLWKGKLMNGGKEHCSASIVSSRLPYLPTELPRRIDLASALPISKIKQIMPSEISKHPKLCHIHRFHEVSAKGRYFTYAQMKRTGDKTAFMDLFTCLKDNQMALQKKVDNKLVFVLPPCSLTEELGIVKSVKLHVLHVLFVSNKSTYKGLSDIALNKSFSGPDDGRSPLPVINPSKVVDIKTELGKLFQRENNFYLAQNEKAKPTTPARVSTTPRGSHNSVEEPSPDKAKNESKKLPKDKLHEDATNSIASDSQVAKPNHVMKTESAPAVAPTDAPTAAPFVSGPLENVEGSFSPIEDESPPPPSSDSKEPSKERRDKLRQGADMSEAVMDAEVRAVEAPDRPHFTHPPKPTRVFAPSAAVALPDINQKINQLTELVLVKERLATLTSSSPSSSDASPSSGSNNNATVREYQSRITELRTNLDRLLQERASLKQAEQLKISFERQRAAERIQNRLLEMKANMNMLLQERASLRQAVQLQANFERLRDTERLQAMTPRTPQPMTPPIHPEQHMRLGHPEPSTPLGTPWQPVPTAAGSVAGMSTPQSSTFVPVVPTPEKHWDKQVDHSSGVNSSTVGNAEPYFSMPDGEFPAMPPPPITGGELPKITPKSVPPAVPPTQVPSGDSTDKSALGTDGGQFPVIPPARIPGEALATMPPAPVDGGKNQTQTTPITTSSQIFNCLKGILTSPQLQSQASIERDSLGGTAPLVRQSRDPLSPAGLTLDSLKSILGRVQGAVTNEHQPGTSMHYSQPLGVNSRGPSSSSSYAMSSDVVNNNKRRIEDGEPNSFTKRLKKGDPNDPITKLASILSNVTKNAATQKVESDVPATPQSPPPWETLSLVHKEVPLETPESPPPWDRCNDGEAGGARQGNNDWSRSVIAKEEQSKQLTVTIKGQPVTNRFLEGTSDLYGLVKTVLHGVTRRMAAAAMKNEFDFAPPTEQEKHLQEIVLNTLHMQNPGSTQIQYGASRMVQEVARPLSNENSLSGSTRSSPRVGNSPRLGGSPRPGISPRAGNSPRDYSSVSTGGTLRYRFLGQTHTIEGLAVEKQNRLSSVAGDCSLEFKRYLLDMKCDRENLEGTEEIQMPTVRREGKPVSSSRMEEEGGDIFKIEEGQIMPQLRREEEQMTPQRRGGQMLPIGTEGEQMLPVRDEEEYMSQSTTKKEQMPPPRREDQMLLIGTGGEPIPPITSEEKPTAPIRTGKENVPSIRCKRERMPKLSREGEQLPHITTGEEQMPPVMNEEKLIPSLNTGEEQMPSLKRQEAPLALIRVEDHMPPIRAGEDQMPPLRREEALVHPHKAEEDQMPPLRRAEAQVPPMRSDEVQLPSVRTEKQMPPARIEEDQGGPLQVLSQKSELTEGGNWWTSPVQTITGKDSSHGKCEGLSDSCFSDASTPVLVIDENQGKQRAERSSSNLSSTRQESPYEHVLQDFNFNMDSGFLSGEEQKMNHIKVHEYSEGQHILALTLAALNAKKSSGGTQGIWNGDTVVPWKESMDGPVSDAFVPSENGSFKSDMSISDEDSVCPRSRVEIGHKNLCEQSTSISFMQSTEREQIEVRRNCSSAAEYGGSVTIEGEAPPPVGDQVPILYSSSTSDQTAQITKNQDISGMNDGTSEVTFCDRSNAGEVSSAQPENNFIDLASESHQGYLVRDSLHQNDTKATSEQSYPQDKTLSDVCIKVEMDNNNDWTFPDLEMDANTPEGYDGATLDTLQSLDSVEYEIPSQHQDQAAGEACTHTDKFGATEDGNLTKDQNQQDHKTQQFGVAQIRVGTNSAIHTSGLHISSSIVAAPESNSNDTQCQDHITPQSSETIGLSVSDGASKSEPTGHSAAYMSTPPSHRSAFLPANPDEVFSGNGSAQANTAGSSTQEGLVPFEEVQVTPSISLHNSSLLPSDPTATYLEDFALTPDLPREEVDKHSSPLGSNQKRRSQIATPGMQTPRRRTPGKKDLVSILFGTALESPVGVVFKCSPSHVDTRGQSSTTSEVGEDGLEQVSLQGDIGSIETRKGTSTETGIALGGLQRERGKTSLHTSEDRPQSECHRSAPAELVDDPVETPNGSSLKDGSRLEAGSEQEDSDIITASSISNHHNNGTVHQSAFPMTVVDTGISQDQKGVLSKSLECDQNEEETTDDRNEKTEENMSTPEIWRLLDQTLSKGQNGTPGKSCVLRHTRRRNLPLKKALLARKIWNCETTHTDTASESHLGDRSGISVSSSAPNEDHIMKEELVHLLDKGKSHQGLVDGREISTPEILRMLDEPLEREEEWALNKGIAETETLPPNELLLVARTMECVNRDPAPQEESGITGMDGMQKSYDGVPDSTNTAPYTASSFKELRIVLNTFGEERKEQDDFGGISGSGDATNDSKYPGKTWRANEKKAKPKKLKPKRNRHKSQAENCDKSVDMQMFKTLDNLANKLSGCLIKLNTVPGGAPSYSHKEPVTPQKCGTFKCPSKPRCGMSPRMLPFKKDYTTLMVSELPVVKRNVFGSYVFNHTSVLSSPESQRASMRGAGNKRGEAARKSSSLRIVLKEPVFVIPEVAKGSEDTGIGKKSVKTAPSGSTGRPSGNASQRMGVCPVTPVATPDESGNAHIGANPPSRSNTLLRFPVLPASYRAQPPYWPPANPENTIHHRFWYYPCSLPLFSASLQVHLLAQRNIYCQRKPLYTQEDNRDVRKNSRSSKGRDVAREGITSDDSNINTAKESARLERTRLSSGDAVQSEGRDSEVGKKCMDHLESGQSRVNAMVSCNPEAVNPPKESSLEDVSKSVPISSMGDCHNRKPDCPDSSDPTSPVQRLLSQHRMRCITSLQSKASLPSTKQDPSTEGDHVSTNVHDELSVSTVPDDPRIPVVDDSKKRRHFSAPTLSERFRSYSHNERAPEIAQTSENRQAKFEVKLKTSIKKLVSSTAPDDGQVETAKPPLQRRVVSAPPIVSGKLKRTPNFSWDHDDTTHRESTGMEGVPSARPVTGDLVEDRFFPSESEDFSVLLSEYVKGRSKGWTKTEPKKKQKQKRKGKVTKRGRRGGKKSKVKDEILRGIQLLRIASSSHSTGSSLMEVEKHVPTDVIPGVCTPKSPFTLEAISSEDNLTEVNMEIAPTSPVSPKLASRSMSWADRDESQPVSSLDGLHVQSVTDYVEASPEKNGVAPATDTSQIIVLSSHDEDIPPSTVKSSGKTEQTVTETVVTAGWSTTDRRISGKAHQDSETAQPTIATVPGKSVDSLMFVTSGNHTSPKLDVGHSDEDGASIPKKDSDASLCLDVEMPGLVADYSSDSNLTIICSYPKSNDEKVPEDRVSSSADRQQSKVNVQSDTQVNSFAIVSSMKIDEEKSSSATVDNHPEEMNAVEAVSSGEKDTLHFYVELPEIADNNSSDSNKTIVYPLPTENEEQESEISPADIEPNDGGTVTLHTDGVSKDDQTRIDVLTKQGGILKSPGIQKFGPRIAEEAIINRSPEGVKTSSDDLGKFDKTMHVSSTRDDHLVSQERDLGGKYGGGISQSDLEPPRSEARVCDDNVRDKGELESTEEDKLEDEGGDTSCLDDTPLLDEEVANDAVCESTQKIQTINREEGKSGSISGAQPQQNTAGNILELDRGRTDAPCPDEVGDKIKEFLSPSAETRVLHPEPSRDESKSHGFLFLDDYEEELDGISLAEDDTASEGIGRTGTPCLDENIAGSVDFSSLDTDSDYFRPIDKSTVDDKTESTLTPENVLRSEAGISVTHADASLPDVVLPGTIKNEPSDSDIIVISTHPIDDDKEVVVSSPGDKQQQCDAGPVMLIEDDADGWLSLGDDGSMDEFLQQESLDTFESTGSARRVKSPELKRGERATASQLRTVKSKDRRKRVDQPTGPNDAAKSPLTRVNERLKASRVKKQKKSPGSKNKTSPRGLKLSDFVLSPEEKATQQRRIVKMKSPRVIEDRSRTVVFKSSPRDDVGGKDAKGNRKRSSCRDTSDIAGVKKRKKPEVVKQQKSDKYMDERTKKNRATPVKKQHRTKEPSKAVPTYVISDSESRNSPTNIPNGVKPSIKKAERKVSVPGELKSPEKKHLHTKEPLKPVPMYGKSDDKSRYGQTNIPHGLKLSEAGRKVSIQGELKCPAKSRLTPGKNHLRTKETLEAVPTYEKSDVKSRYGQTNIRSELKSPEKISRRVVTIAPPAGKKGFQLKKSLKGEEKQMRHQRRIVETCSPGKKLAKLSFLPYPNFKGFQIPKLSKEVGTQKKGNAPSAPVYVGPKLRTVKIILKDLEANCQLKIGELEEGNKQTVLEVSTGETQPRTIIQKEEIGEQDKEPEESPGPDGEVKSDNKSPAVPRDHTNVTCNTPGRNWEVLDEIGQFPVFEEQKLQPLDNHILPEKRAVTIDENNNTIPSPPKLAAIPGSVKEKVQPNLSGSDVKPERNATDAQSDSRVKAAEDRSSRNDGQTREVQATARTVRMVGAAERKTKSPTELRKMKEAAITKHSSKSLSGSSNKRYHPYKPSKINPSRLIHFRKLYIPKMDQLMWNHNWLSRKSGRPPLRDIFSTPNVAPGRFASLGELRHHDSILRNSEEMEPKYTPEAIPSTRRDQVKTLDKNVLKFAATANSAHKLLELDSMVYSSQPGQGPIRSTHQHRSSARYHPYY